MKKTNEAKPNEISQDIQETLHEICSIENNTYIIALSFTLIAF